MATRNFRTKRTSNSIVVPAGTSSVTIPVHFVPDFIRVKFQDLPTGASSDSLHYSFNAAPATIGAFISATLASAEQNDANFTPYELLINWTTSETRTIRYVVAQLPTDSEQTIAFNFN